MYNLNWHTCQQDSAEGYKYNTIKSTGKEKERTMKPSRIKTVSKTVADTAFKGALKHLLLILWFLCHWGFSPPLIIGTRNTMWDRATSDVKWSCINVQEKIDATLNVL